MPADADAVPVKDDKIRCDACPVMCFIKPGMTGACDRYANADGELVRVDPHVLLDRTLSHGGEVVPFVRSDEWDGSIVPQAETFVTAIGAGTTYPDYKPAPFIVPPEVDGVDMVDGGDRRHLQLLRRQGEDRHRPLHRPGDAYGAGRGRGGRPCHNRRIRLADALARRCAPPHRRLEEGGPRHLRRAPGAVQRQGGRDDASTAARRWWSQAGRAPIVNGKPRRACASAAARPPSASSPSSGTGKVDEVVVVDDHITGVLSEHQAGKLLGIPDTGIRLEGTALDARRAISRWRSPALGWGGTDIDDPLADPRPVRTP